MGTGKRLRLEPQQGTCPASRLVILHKPFHVSEHQFSAELVEGAALPCLSDHPTWARLQEAEMTQGEEGAGAAGKLQQLTFPEKFAHP